MIGALVALLSLDMTRKLIAAGMAYSTLTVTGATTATPVVITTSTPHGVIRPAHAVVSGLGGLTASYVNQDGVTVDNTVWICTPVTTTTLSLSTYTLQGVPVPSIGTGTYTSGGTVQIAFPEGSILLGKRNVNLATAVATPRIVFVPIGSPNWDYDPAGGVIPISTTPRRLSAQTAEQKFMKLERQLATERSRFEVHVTGAATPSDPDFGDFDATQAIYQSLYGSLFDLISPARAKVLSGNWTSQTDDDKTGKLDVRGQKWVGVIEISQYVTDNSLAFVPASTDGTMTVNFVSGASADQTILVIP